MELLHERHFDMAMTHDRKQGTTGRILSERGPISVAEIREALGVSRERLGRVLDVSARTIQRWEEQNQLPGNKWILQVLVEIQNIVDVGTIVWQPEGFRRVMNDPMPVFGDRSGLDLIENGEGRYVLGEFASMYEGYLGR
jgi:DNA-binding transcriptional regulator YiaG